MRFFKIYTKSNCELECLTNYTLVIIHCTKNLQDIRNIGSHIFQSKCGCVKFDMPRDNITKVCDINQSECYINAQYHIWELETEEDPEELYVAEANVTMDCNCLPSCNSIEYLTEITQISYDWNSFIVAAKLPVSKTEQ